MMALTSQTIALRKAKAMSAFHSEQVLVPSREIPLQLKTYLRSSQVCTDGGFKLQRITYPQVPFSQLTIRPKATNQQIEMTTSIGQWMKELANGNSQMIDKKMDKPATTSV
jgi:hypothetical protein